MLYSSAMGMAAIGVALYKYVMKFSPKNEHYFNRDRFVLSNGRLYSGPCAVVEVQLMWTQVMLAYGSIFSCILSASRA